MTTPPPHGVVVVDKPSGMTSHDVVRVVRRAFRTRRVGHAGTLDPMATGVLVVGIGEGTKLLHHLTAEDKAYLATVKLGTETDSLDADGEPIAHAPLPVGLSQTAVALVAEGFLGRGVQVVPKISAIKQQGVALYERVRRGEEVSAPEREVFVHELEILAVRDDEIDLRVRAGKGFYVRSLARDLAVALGTRGHLCALRRVASGLFVADEAVNIAGVDRGPIEESIASALHAALLPLAQALRGVATVTVAAEGFEDVRQGRALVAERLVVSAMPPEGTEPVGIVGDAGALIGLGRVRGGRVEIIRGILA